MDKPYDDDDDDDDDGCIDITAAPANQKQSGVI